MSELEKADPEYQGIINFIKNGVNVKKLPDDNIIKQFARKKKNTEEIKKAYYEMYTVDTRRASWYT